MPRKTKESNENKIKAETKKTTKTASTKKVNTTSRAKQSKTTTLKSTSKRKATTSSTKPKSSKRTDTSSTKKTAKSKATPKAKKVATKSAKTLASARASTKPKKEIVEYYDLPYRYSQTIVKVLAQTPTNLFIYWDISDTDRENYIKEYGEDFFENTRPVLIIYNDTLNYSFEVEINDFANSWYLHVNDSKCDYRVELGRRPKIYNKKNPIKDYIYISSSNEIESPNDKILFDKKQQMVYFKNVKTNSVNGKSVANISFIRNMGKIYNIYDLYKEIYKNENIEILSNPSSGNF